MPTGSRAVKGGAVERLGRARRVASESASGQRAATSDSESSLRPIYCQIPRNSENLQVPISQPGYPHYVKSGYSTILHPGSIYQYYRRYLPTYGTFWAIISSKSKTYACSGSPGRRSCIWAIYNQGLRGHKCCTGTFRPDSLQSPVRMLYWSTKQEERHECGAGGVRTGRR